MSRHATSAPSPRARPTRTGSIYLLVLGGAVIVTLMGMAAVTSSRIATRTAARGRDWAQAGLLATSAVEIAVARINRDVAWRSAHATGVPVVIGPLGRGTLRYVLVDDDGSLTDELTDPVQVLGIATVGDTTRCFSVMAAPASAGVPLPALSSIIHSAGTLSQLSGALSLDGGPLTTNSSLTIAGTLTGNAECQTAVITGTVDGTVLTGVDPRAMPSPSVVAVYNQMASVIPWTSLVSQRIENALVSPSSPPTAATPPSPSGVYAITVPAGSTLTIRYCRLRATLLVTLEAGASLRVLKSLLWDPPRPDFPCLIVSGGALSNVEFGLDAARLSEPGTGRNFNPPSDPYAGLSDADLLDTYASELHGLYHIIGPSSTVRVTTEARFAGTLLAEGSVELINTASFSHEPGLLSVPPIGYTARTGTMVPVRGTWQWAAAP
ncbi:MAG TPA: polymer-forming cytoskeletal protein [Phycisphaerales bacterium]|nr:polymer-forming cytoskeletal protein [Phycisphaerales bacterium]